MTVDPQSQQKTSEPTSSATEQPFRPPEVVVGTSAPAVKADLTKRAIAAVIDGVAAALMGMIPFLGGLIGAAYMLVRDGLDVEFMPNRSLGKKLVGLQAVTMDGRPVDIETSIRRNWPFAFGGVVAVLAWIPFIGWLLMIPVALVALGVGLMEIYLVITSPDGRRLGDKTGDTRVIEVAA